MSTNKTRKRGQCENAANSLSSIELKGLRDSLENVFSIILHTFAIRPNMFVYIISIVAEGEKWTNKVPPLQVPTWWKVIRLQLFWECAFWRVKIIFNYGNFCEFPHFSRYLSMGNWNLWKMLNRKFNHLGPAAESLDWIRFGSFFFAPAQLERNFKTSLLINFSSKQQLLKHNLCPNGKSYSSSMFCLYVTVQSGKLNWS